ncbi:MAG: hypothetical protein D6B25_14345 [Desulfobulbaceae bacterium]|nr:MAG: hypothetical protein D6B25_14345 [Desulfobulbaceae bacterium]
MDENQQGAGKTNGNDWRQEGSPNASGDSVILKGDKMCHEQSDDKAITALCYGGDDTRCTRGTAVDEICPTAP